METIKYIIATGLLGFMLLLSAFTILGLIWQMIDLIRYSYAVMRGKTPHTQFWKDLNIK